MTGSTTSWSFSHPVHQVGNRTSLHAFTSVMISMDNMDWTPFHGHAAAFYNDGDSDEAVLLISQTWGAT